MPRPLVRMETTGSRTEIYLWGQIWPWTVQDVLDQVRALPEGTTEIHLHIFSEGGDAISGLALFNLFAGHPARIVTYVDTYVASAATMPLMAGDEVVAPENSWIVIHLPYLVGWVEAEADELRQQADFLDRLTDQVVAIYRRHTTWSEEEVRAAISVETWLTAQQALEAGFVQRLEPAAAAPVALTADALASFRNVPAAVRALLAAAPTQEDPPMPRPTPATPPAPAPAPTLPPTAAPPPSLPADGTLATLAQAVAADRQALAADRQALAADRTALAADRALARCERAATRLERTRAQLGSRVTPASWRALEPTLRALAEAEVPPTVQTAGADGTVVEVEQYDQIVRAYMAMPEHSALLGPALAGADAGEALALDTRSPEERAVCDRHGIDAARAVELRTRRPAFFRSEPMN